MEIAVEKLDGIAVAVMPVDELDASNAPEFKRDIAPRAAGEHKAGARSEPPAFRG